MEESINSIDAGMARLVAAIPAGWLLNFVSETDGIWQMVLKREADGRAQAGTGATVSEALAQVIQRIDSEAPTLDGEAVNRHPTIEVQVGEWRADIDEAIAPLIETLWKLGIETQSSCQGGPSARGHITFPDANYAAAFLDIIGRELDPLESRAFGIERLALRSLRIGLPTVQRRCGPIRRTRSTIP